MPLPVTITGISTAVAPVGPFAVAPKMGPLVISTALGNLITSMGSSANGTERVGQVFTVGENGGSLASAQLFLQKVGAPTDNIVVNVYKADAAGLIPTGASLATASVLASTVVNGSWITFTFATPLALTANTKYVLTAQRSGAINTSNYVSWYGGADTYPGGYYCVYYSTTGKWTTETPYFNGHCMLLQLFDAGVGTSTLITTTVATALTPFGNAARPQVGQTFTTTGDLSITKIGFRLRRTSGNTTDQIAVDIYATDAGGLPTGPSLGRAAGPTKWISTSRSDEYSFWFDAPIALVAGKYAAVLSRTGSTDEANYFNLLGASTDVYAGGSLVSFNGTSWSATASSDGALKITYLTVPTYYLFGFNDIGGSDGRRLVTLKADDPSSEWTLINSLPTIGNTPIYQMAGYQVGGVFHILLSQSGSPTINDVRYCKWDSATDSWAVNNETVVANVSMTGTTFAQSNGVSLVVRSTGDVVAFYNGASSNTSGKPYCRLYYRIRSNAGTWGTAVRVDANTAFDNTSPEAVLGASDIVHFLWAISSSMQHRALSAANALQTASTYSITSWAPEQAISYSSAGVTKVVAVSTNAANRNTAVRFDSGLTPTLAGTSTGNNANARTPSRIFNNGETLHVLELLTTASDLNITSSTDHGATWSAHMVAFAGTVATSSTNLSKDATIYQRDNNFVIPYLVNDNGIWKYNEYDVTPPTVDAWNRADKSANITLSNADKTAIVSATGASGVHSTQTQMSATAGKYYAELKVEAVGGQLGMQMTATDETNAGFANSYYVGTDGRIWSSTQVVGTVGSALVAGDVVCLATDFGAKLYWFKKNNDFWNNSATADPATGVGGLASYGSAFPFSLWFGGGAIGSGATIRTELADLTLQGPAGFTTWMGEVIPLPSIADAWNVNDVGVDVSQNLSNGDKTVTATGAGTGAARSTQKRVNGQAGLYYAECRVDQPYLRFGLKLVTSAIASQTADALYVSDQGLVLFNGVTQINLGRQPIAGDVISIAWDSGAEKFWARINALPWNNNVAADPATGANGLDASVAIAGDWALWFQSGVASSAGTIRTEKDEFTQSTPAGFLSWMGETLVIPDMGTLVSGAASITGVGDVTWAGTGNLAPQPSTVIGLAASRSTGTGALVAVGYTRTNLLARSQEFDMWAAENALRTGNTTTAPDSTLTADTLSDGVATGTHYLYQQNLPATSGANYTFSVYLKAGTLNWAQVMLITPNVRWANFDLSTGTLGQKESAAVTASRTYVSDGWWRCSVTATLQAGTNYIGGFIALKQADVVFSQQHTGTGATFYAWGAQLERGDVATAYIPTTTAAVTISETLIGTGTVSWNATGALKSGESRTNYLVQSQALAFYPPWNTLRLVVTDNVVAAPDATMTAEKLADTAVNDSHYLMQYVDTVAETYTYSFFFKNNDHTGWVQLSSGGGWANFNIATGVTGLKVGVTSAIEPLADGWYRCSITGAMPGGSSINFNIYLMLADVSSRLYLGSGKSIYAWGGQIERTPAPTAYIPTTTAPVTIGNSPLLTGAGVVTTPPAYGTGALTTSIAGLAGLGISSSVGTAPLVAAGKTRINHFLYSQQFDIGTWTKAASVITAENAIAPDNTLTADLLTDTVASANHYMMQSGVGFTAPIGTNTYSIYIKSKTLTWIQLRVSDIDTFWVNFNIVTGAKGLDSANGLTTIITPVGNGWYRCSVTFPHPQTNWNANCFVIMQVADEPISNFVGTGLSAWLWGAQFELGGQVTAYIPTINSVVSVTDVLTGVGLIDNTGTGVLVVTQPATLSGEGGIQWNATGVLASHPATVVGVGKAVDPPTTGTGALISLGIAAVAGTGTSASIGGSIANDLVIYGGTKNQYTWGRTSVSGIGQVFIATGPVITQVTPYIGKVLTPTDSVVVKLYTSAGGLPGTLLGTSDPILGSDLPNSNSLPVTFTFPTPIPVQNGTSYVVTFTRTGAFDANGYYLNGYVSSSIYAGGGMITMSSGSWTTSASIYDTWTTISQSYTKGLVPSDATITAPGGFVEYIATGALVNDPAVIESIGSVIDGPAHGTGVLVNLGIANVVGVAISGSVGAPNLQPSNSVASGAGVTKVDGSAVLTSSNAAVNSVGLVRDIIKGPGVLAAGASALTALGTAMTPAKGDGVLVVTALAVVQGNGIVEWNVTGTGALTNTDPSVLIAQGKSETRGTGALTSTSTIVGGGFIRWIVTGALVQSRPTITAPGVSRSIGSGAFVVSNTAAVSGLGSVFSGVSGIGTLTSFATLSAIGRSESKGVSVLTSSAVSVTGVSTSLSSGAAVLTDLPSVLAASGKSIFAATGSLADQPASISGVGSARWLASGTLPAPAATLTALGASRWSGIGILTPALAAVTGSGIGQAIGAGVLPAAPSTIVSFEGVTVISGTGTLQVGASAVTGSAYSIWRGTGSLISTASILAGVGGSIWRMSGALVPAPAVVAATGIGAVQGTAPLLAARSTVYGYEGVSVITGTGALQSQSYLATGLGFSRTSGAGTLTEAPFGVVGEGLIQSTGAGVLLDVQSALSGTGLSATGGSGVLGSTATVSGSGQAQWLGSGVLTSDIAGLVAAAVSGSRGVAPLGVGLSTLSAIGQSDVKGTAALTSSSAIMIGFANLVSSGAGVLVAEDHVVEGSGLQFASGWGQLYSYRFEIEGLGQTWNTGVGNLISHYPALMLGRGAVSSNAIGVLQAGTAKIVGGSIQTTGLGVLLAQRSTIHGVGYVETITPPVEGEWVPTPLPPSYHGVASWGGASMVRPWVNPGIQPWRRVG